MRRNSLSLLSSIRGARRLFVLLVALALAVPAVAADKLTPEQRTSELRQVLRKLHTTARLLHTTAHPDDEDGGMLTLESRGHGAAVTLLTLTRGEGGQNKMGSSLLDSLGVLRTLELLAADKYYGVEQRFTRVADFGFSKTADETLEKWHGHDVALADMVRVIRTFRPDVIVSRFNGTPADGHGHHQAAGILTREAFRAAADPTRFPEQLREGLQPWQAQKFYMDNVKPFGSTAPVPPEAYTLALDSGVDDPLLGMSYAQYANQGLKHQLSQGAEAWNVGPGPHLSYYRLVDSVLPMPRPGEHEKDFFDGIDTSLPGLADRVPEQQRAAVPWLRPRLVELQQDIDKATHTAETNPSAATAPLLAALKLVDDLIAETQHVEIAPATKQSLLASLRTKRGELEQAANLAGDVDLVAVIDAAPANDPQLIPVAVPGQSVMVRVSPLLAERSHIQFGKVSLEVPPGWRVTALPPSAAEWRFRIQVPPDAQLTRPYWHRADPEQDTIYTLDYPQYATLPFIPPQVRAHADFSAGGASGTVSTVVQTAYRDKSNKVHEMPLGVAPAFSVALAPASVIMPLSKRDGTRATASVQKNGAETPGAELRVEPPAGWRSQPDLVPMSLNPEARGLREFALTPEHPELGRTQARAAATSNGHPYTEGYTVITRPDLDAAFYYQPAAERISVVDVKAPRGLKIGYVMGAGDDIPLVLKQVGLNVSEITEPELATGDLRRYDTIVLGIRAYDTRKDLREHNQRILDYVQQGGTLVVQYNSGIADFNGGRFAPYPAQLGRERVTVEQAPVAVLDAQNPVFHYPNEITGSDFNGWVQERGLYFMSTWDPHFTPLLESHDPNDSQLKGGMLYARYGKGTYIYTGYSFFRQLPAGVPGAVRLFVNLVSAGHEDRAVE